MANHSIQSIEEWQQNDQYHAWWCPGDVSQGISITHDTDWEMMTQDIYQAKNWDLPFENDQFIPDHISLNAKSQGTIKQYDQHSTYQEENFLKIHLPDQQFYLP